MNVIITLFRIISLALSLFLCKKKINLAARLQKMGPSFVKFGQSFSSRPDIFGKEITGSLLMLCDKLPQFPFLQVKKIIEKELKKPLEEIFPYFEEKPVSAASIAQVHRAYTMDGYLVAVKVLRPNIAKRFKQDIRLLKFCSIILLPFIHKRFKINEVIKLFSENIKLELDLRFEAANAEELRASVVDTDNIYIPTIDWRHTSQKVMTMEWIEGKSISKYHDNPKLAKALAVSFVNQAYTHGFFHGDMHAGNVLVTEDDKFALVDFGIMGRLDKKNKIYVAEILIAFLKRDYKRVADVHFRAGYVSSKYHHFITACRAIGEPMMSKRLSAAELLSQLFKIMSDFNIQVQPQLLLLQKTILLVEGHCLRLYPEGDLLKLIEPNMDKWAYDNLSLKVKICDSALIHRAQSIAMKCENALDVFSNKTVNSHNNNLLLKISVLLIILYLILDKIM